MQNGLTELNDTAAAQDRIAAATETARPAANGQRPLSAERAAERQTETAIQTLLNPERAFWPWLGFWVQILVLAVLATIGAFAASAADGSGDYACGMVLTLAAIALAFLRVKHHLDGARPGLAESLLITDMWNLALVVPLFTVIGLGGLFIAQGADSEALHIAGLALFIASGGAIFLNLKHVFDQLERARRH